MEFESIEAAYSFYQKYALSSGFSVRKASQYVSKGFLRIKYSVCTKEGHKIMKPVDTLDKNTKHKFERRKPSQRTGCTAHIKLQLEDNGRYKLYGLMEGYNHSFVRQDDVHFLRAARELTFNKKQIIHGLSNINIVPVRAFNILRTMFGGFDNVGATKDDCKNFKREINLYIGDYDVEMVVQRMLRKKEFCPNFSFDYIADKDGILRGMFRADGNQRGVFTLLGMSYLLMQFIVTIGITWYLYLSPESTTTTAMLQLVLHFLVPRPLIHIDGC